ncbi:unnamed protein product [Darwinula stevensoni]|uniref:F-box domain-containing protein n=1 Tax=Darwinula stevensoni TaxID=69355 RepID=A0A7R8X3F8_9CRUS|nr:unnamed protein product [Darwinula stevensoni]CAG0884318.1 unnamed protein product [Darwinula stevensoni]
MDEKFLDINLASAEELATLKGVGLLRAKAIVETRTCLGGFTSVDDLNLVAGVGGNVIQQNRHALVCSVPGPSSDAQPPFVGSSRKRDGRKPQGEKKGSTPVPNRRKGEHGSSSKSSTPPQERRSSRASSRSSKKAGQDEDDDVGSPIMSSLETPADSKICIWDANNERIDNVMGMQDSEYADNCDSLSLLCDAADQCSRDLSAPGSDSHRTMSGSEDASDAWSDDIEDTPSAEEISGKMRKLNSGEKLFELSHFWLIPWIIAVISSCITYIIINRDGGDSVAEKSSEDHKEPVIKQLSPDIKVPDGLDAWLATFKKWTHSERIAAVDDLIDICELPQVRHMMEIIEPQFQRDFISLLPKELSLYVLSFLEPKDLLVAAQVCKSWQTLTEDNLLWREKCQEAGIEYSRDFPGGRRKTASSASSHWKVAFMRQHNIELNWRSRPIRPPKVLKGHDDHVITCLQFSGNRIVSGSDDNTLKVWSAVTGKCLRTLVGHTGGVWSSQMANNIIVSGSTDRTLKVWNADTGQCIHTLYGHTSTVRCMSLNGNKVVSGSRDATLRMWDISSGHCLHVLVGHVAAVRCVQYNGKLVVSGAYDYMVKVWNPEREECIHTLQGHTNRVYSLQFDGIHVVSGSLDTSIRVWDVESGQCRHTLVGHQSLTSGMELKNNTLVSGNADSTVKVWDIITGNCLQTLSGPHKHQSAVTCLQFNKNFVITSSDDGTVKLWDVRTGEFIRDLVALESGGSGGVVWRIKASNVKLVCAVGSRNGTEETKLFVLDFDAEVK